MKLTSLLAQYLYTNHRLDLPGIGTFLLDPATISSLDTSTGKQKSTVLSGITFENNTSLKDSPDLITFITSQTGKMKALAHADLESYIQQAQQFLNIGKQFTFEGIGTLAKIKAGEFDFTPLSVAADKLREYQVKETTSVTLEESSAQYESFLGSPKTNFGWRRPVVALLILAGVGLAIWGGYTISKKAASADITEVADTTQQIVQPDTLTQKNEPVKSNDNKYILQVSKKNTALKRLEQLKTNLWDVHMETNDSVSFKLFLLIPASRTDTTHLLDSLISLTGKKVYIEHQN